MPRLAQLVPGAPPAVKMRLGQVALDINPDYASSTKTCKHNGAMYTLDRERFMLGEMLVRPLTNGMDFDDLAYAFTAPSNAAQLNCGPSCTEVLCFPAAPR